MRFLEGVMDGLIYTKEDGTIIFRSSDFFGRKYIIPSQQQADALRLKIKSFLRIAYCVVLGLFIVTISEYQDKLVDVTVVLLIAFSTIRFFYFKKLTKNLTCSE